MYVEYRPPQKLIWVFCTSLKCGRNQYGAATRAKILQILATTENKKFHIWQSGNLYKLNEEYTARFQAKAII